LAAGNGTRMNSDIPKVLHKICGKPMISILVQTVRNAGIEDIVVVTGFKEDLVKAELGETVTYVTQNELLGTGHAVMQAKDSLTKEGDVVVLCGDVPLISKKTILDLIEANKDVSVDATVVTMMQENCFGYGRIIKDNAGRVIRIVEEKDAASDEKLITEVNTGMYYFNNKDLVSALDQVSNKNSQNEYYLTDVIQILSSENKKIKSFVLKNNIESIGINSKKELTVAEKYLQQRILFDFIDQGVTIINPELVYIEADVVIDRNTIIEPFVRIGRGARIGQNCRIGSFVSIAESEIVGNNEEKV